MIETPIERVLGKLQGLTGRKPQWYARCPGHDDKRASFSVRENPDGQVLLKCQAGCTFEDVLDALGMKAADLFPPNPAYTGGNGKKRDEVARYTYTDEQGVNLFQKRRYLPKTFLLYRWESGDWQAKLNPSVRRVLYRLPEVVAAIKEGRVVWVVEGCKDSDNLAALGLCATTNFEGASEDTKKPKWRDEYTETLRGANVVVIPDNDSTGHAHAANIAKVLHGVAKSVRILELPGLPEKGDVSDWLANGGTKEKLRELVKETPLWEPQAEPTPPPPEKPLAIERQSAIRSLAEILSDPQALAGIEEVVPRFAWAARVTLLSGREKLGKSTLTGAMAAAVSQGGRFAGRDVVRGPVLIVGLEEHSHDLALRLNEFHADPQSVFALDAVPAGTGAFEEVERAVADLTDTVGAPRLIILDTLPAFAQGSGLVPDGSSSALWTPVMARLTAIARKSGAAIVLNTHACKNGGGYRDSSAIGAGVDCIIEMEDVKDEEGARKFACKARWRVSGFTLKLEGTEYRDTGGQVSLDARVQFYIAEHPGCSGHALRTGIGGRGEETDRAAKKLAREGIIHDQGTTPNHAYYPGPSPENRDEGWDHPHGPTVSPLGRTTDDARTRSGTTGSSQILSLGASIGTTPQTVPDNLGVDWEVTP